MWSEDGTAVKLWVYKTQIVLHILLTLFESPYPSRAHHLSWNLKLLRFLLSVVCRDTIASITAGNIVQICQRRVDDFENRYPVGDNDEEEDSEANKGQGHIANEPDHDLLLFAWDYERRSIYLRDVVKRQAERVVQPLERDRSIED